MILGEFGNAPRPVRYRSVHDVISDHYVRVFSTRSSTVAHAAMSAFADGAVCGVQPHESNHWLGTGDQDEIDHAASLHPCGECARRLRVAFGIEVRRCPSCGRPNPSAHHRCATCREDAA